MTIAVVLLTYNRIDYALTTLAAAAQRLKSDCHDIVWHVASDGDEPSYVAALTDALEQLNVERVTTSNAARGGYGKNFNLAMQAAHHNAEWVLPLEDDWELTKPLNFDPIIKDMEALDIGCARLGYIGYTQELRGKLVYGSNAGHWLLFDPESPEPHVFAGHPRIESVRWAREVGPWPEGLLPGQTEFDVAHRPEARRRVAWPLDVVHPRGDLFVHIGTERSY